MPHTTEGRAQGFAGARVYWIMKGKLVHLCSTRKIFPQLLSFRDIISVAWNQPWWEYSYMQIGKCTNQCLCMYLFKSFIHWKANCSTFISTSLILLQLCRHCPGAANESSDLYSIILVGLHLWMRWYLVGAMDPIVKCIFSCLCYYKMVTWSGKKMCRIQF